MKIIEKPKQIQNVRNLNNANGLNLIEEFVVKIVNLFILNKVIESTKKVLRQKINLSQKRLYANNKVKEIYYSFVQTKYKTIEIMTEILRTSKAKTKLIFPQNYNTFYDAMNCRRQSGIFLSEEDLFSESG